jgi:type I site-specific restriction endonuclease
MTRKQELSEQDICTRYILPALQKAGWDIQTQVRQEVSFTDGRIYVKGDKTTRGKKKRADFILYCRRGGYGPIKKDIPKRGNYLISWKNHFNSR